MPWPSFCDCEDLKYHFRHSKKGSTSVDLCFQTALSEEIVVTLCCSNPEPCSDCGMCDSEKGGSALLSENCESCKDARASLLYAPCMVKMGPSLELRLALSRMQRHPVRWVQEAIIQTITLLSPLVPPSTRRPVTAHRSIPLSHFPSLLALFSGLSY